jgi:hypothetical protein
MESSCASIEEMDVEGKFVFLEVPNGMNADTFASPQQVADTLN